jgi:alpha-N-arabinofuranosidase
MAATEKKTPAFVCRRMQHHQFECTTRMLFNPSDEKEAAGLLLFKDENHQYFLSVSQSGSKRRIALVKISENGNTILGEQEIPDWGKDKPMDLKVVSSGTHYDFYYALTEGKWVALCQHIPAQYLSTANCGGFTGTTIGMYATGKSY